ncbi:hypothetical protein [Sorangium cellulosum]|uniref:hypothetical protein n=1 Tax=Sorangium cellulosum TaxID=56 RepID=UPI003D9A0D8C
MIVWKSLCSYRCRAPSGPVSESTRPRLSYVRSVFSSAAAPNPGRLTDTRRPNTSYDLLRTFICPSSARSACATTRPRSSSVATARPPVASVVSTTSPAVLPASTCAAIDVSLAAPVPELAVFTRPRSS